MDGFAVLVALLVLGVLVLTPILAIVALVRVGSLSRELRALEDRLGSLESAPRPHTAAAPVGVREPAAPVPVAPVPVAPRAPAPPPPATLPPPREPVGARSPAVEASRPTPAAPPATTRVDFATQLGPKVLVAGGALAFIVFLGLFVRHAWENDWVGPSGRVLTGAVAGLGLVAWGLRMMRREYGPLGQGIAAMGLAGLYVSAFAAHGFYQLVPRGFAGALMLGITVCAVALSARLDARLFAGLGWVGGYLTPVLLTTGADRGEALLAYLLVLNLGALFLDHRQPWPETLPLALLGTLVLYTGWYAEHFEPQRFGVAAAGIALFTAQFALGAARKQRAWGLGAVLGLAGLGLSVLAAGADRPAPLIAMSLGLAALGLHSASRIAAGLSVVAGAAIGLPLAAWAAAHWSAAQFGWMGVWIAAGALLLVVSAPGVHTASQPVLEVAALLLGGGAVAAMAVAADRPLSLAALLAAMGAVAVLARARWRWAEAAGVAAAALASHAWLGAHFDPGREGEALTLVAGVAGGYLALFAVAGFAFGRRTGWPEVAAHMVAAGLLWSGLYRILSEESSLLGPISVGLAALYLALGLAARRRDPVDSRHVVLLLGLAAGFLTLAVPVQLGLHGITLAWAAEAAVLFGLGVRFGARLARWGGYALLGVAALRLVYWHLPLHAERFTPVLNPAFGTWLAVVLFMGAVYVLARGPRRAGESPDRQLGPVLAGLGLLLLFSLLTGETQSAFEQQASIARGAGDAAAAQAARFRGSLAVSALWASFATGLLGAGLAARGRPLFYSGYALFALTAAKLVLLDLANLQAVYRMLSFLVVALLLLAGAYLNLRFRTRLLPEPDA